MTVLAVCWMEQPIGTVRGDVSACVSTPKSPKQVAHTTGSDRVPNVDSHRETLHSVPIHSVFEEAPPAAANEV